MKIKTVKSLKLFWEIEPHKKRYIYLPEEIVTTYPIKESGEELVSVLKEFKKNGVKIFFKPPKGSKTKTLKLRRTACAMLLLAARKLPEGYCFKISEGLRSLNFQKKEFDKIYKKTKNMYPKLAEDQLWQEVTKYIADPNLCPPHTTGGAIDLTIVDKKGKNLDMGNPLNSSDEKSNTFSNLVSKIGQKNRKVLFEAMTSVGFVNLPTEWWHYSYGEQYWAIFNQKKNAIYGKLKE